MTSRSRRRERLWVVRAGDGATLADIVRRMGDDPTRAVAEGRVFVARRRAVRVDAPVAVGDAVTLGPREASAPAASSPAAGARVEVLFVRDGVVATVKPAGLPTVPDHRGAAHSLVALVARELGRDARALRVTSRLDREVSGVVLFALDDAAEARLREARERHAYVRRYLAIATGARALADEGTWDAPIGRGKDPRHRAAGGPEAKPARTRYRVASRAGDLALLAVEPETGRTHQIRVHASHAGAPLLGDRDYGGPARVTSTSGRVVGLARIALHAARVVVPGAGGEPLSVTAPPPVELARVWADLGGAPEAWDTALACVVPSVSPPS